MPSIGEQGWGELVSNNFEILDTILNTFNINIGDGTRILSILSSPIINFENFSNYAFYDNNNVYIASFDTNTTFSSIPQPPHSCRLMIISVNGDATISGNINTYPKSLQSETPPNSETTNTYNNTITLNEPKIPITLTYTANENNSQISMNYDDYLNFINNNISMFNSKSYSLSIPHAIAAGGVGKQNGTAGTATNTCNGGGGGSTVIDDTYTGGTGCIFGQYLGTSSNGYGYGSSASNKFRCALIFVVNGNLTINESCAITQIGGNGLVDNGGYGGGARTTGGGGAPVFIYYTGTYVNNGTINTAGGKPYTTPAGNVFGGDGGAGGIKVTKISI